MAAPPQDCFGKIFPVGVEISKCHVSQCSHIGEMRTQAAHSRFALGPPVVVFALRDTVLHHGVTDYKGHAG